MTQGSEDQVVKALDRLSMHIERLERVGGSAGTGTSNVTVQLGGSGLILVACVTCALFCAGAVIFGAVSLMSQRQDIASMQADLRGQRAYINQIYLREDSENDRQSAPR